MSKVDAVDGSHPPASNVSSWLNSDMERPEIEVCSAFNTGRDKGRSRESVVDPQQSFIVSGVKQVSRPQFSTILASVSQVAQF